VALVGGHLVEMDLRTGAAPEIGSNSGSTLPTGVAAALQNQASATVQLVSSDASCFGVSLTQVKKADGAVFKAVTP
jgi:hypothetical protein